MLQRLRNAYNFPNPLRYNQIEVVESTDDCQRIVAILKKHCTEYGVLGFDCEWVTVEGQPRVIALLQLASHRGLCALIRLNTLKSIPEGLKELLEDERIIKVGIGPYDDAVKLSHDYGVGVASTFDLRYLAVLTDNNPEGLTKMSRTVLNVTLNKKWRLVCSDWEAQNLTESQTEYAAKVAMVAVEIFKKMSSVLEKRRFWQKYDSNLKLVIQQCEPYLGVCFKDDFTKSRTLSGIHFQLKKSAKCAMKKPLTQDISTRSKSLYDNYLLEASDVEVPCTGNRKKAHWCLEEQVQSNPSTVRLNTKPAERAVCHVGHFYQTPKKNQCVVCERNDPCIRKNVSPRVYKKFFPIVTKSQSSQNVLFLCSHCNIMCSF